MACMDTCCMLLHLFPCVSGFGVPCAGFVMPEWRSCDAEVAFMSKWLSWICVGVFMACMATVCNQVHAWRGYSLSGTAGMFWLLGSWTGSVHCGFGAFAVRAFAVGLTRAATPCAPWLAVGSGSRAPGQGGKNTAGHTLCTGSSSTGLSPVQVPLWYSQPRLLHGFTVS
jgi:hypothetical protein